MPRLETCPFYHEAVDTVLGSNSLLHAGVDGGMRTVSALILLAGFFYLQISVGDFPPAILLCITPTFLCPFLPVADQESCQADIIEAPISPHRRLRLPTHRVAFSTSNVNAGFSRSIPRRFFRSNTSRLTSWPGRGGGGGADVGRVHHTSM